MRALTCFTFGLILMAGAGCIPERNEWVTFPYSQWTTGTGSHHITWEYENNLTLNRSFIALPDSGQWESWYNSLLEYRETARESIGKTPPRLHFQLRQTAAGKTHFDKFGYDLELQPGEPVRIRGRIRGNSAPVNLLVEYDLKTTGEERSYVVRDRLVRTDSTRIPASGEWHTFEITTSVPAFQNDRYAITPTLRWETTEPERGDTFDVRGVTLGVKPDSSRTVLIRRIENHLEREAQQASLDIPEELAWTHDNFVMGFAFIWDQDLWDPEKGTYTVDRFCDKMEREFGGFQSVILWHSYPNIGIDEKNQFDMFRALPGGLDGLREVTAEFHSRGVKVFITYNPWDLDTRRPEESDNRELAKVAGHCNVDGIYLDTWKSSTGVISIFSTRTFMREAVEQQGHTVAFATEIHPDFKDLSGYHALTSSWGQEIHPFHYTDLSHVKWIMPEHKQYYIKRMNADRSRELTHAWLNGQGIQVWENIFGTMNLWNAGDRGALRRMNAIWKAVGGLYITDRWKPFLPQEHPRVAMSVWDEENRRIWNLADTTGGKSIVRLPLEIANGKQYFDLWNGTELKPEKGPGNAWYVELEVEEFGCLLETDSRDALLDALLEKQQAEAKRTIPGRDSDPHVKERSLKRPVPYSYPPSARNPSFRVPLKPIGGGTFDMQTRHIWREGHCYPDMDAGGNHDLDVRREEGVQVIIHEHRARLDDYRIMPRVVTNGEFEQFLQATGYAPRFDKNFLAHWNGRACPDSLREEPVVHVSLEDARAFAAWTGMQLPTEWQWQHAAEKLGSAFVHNEVFEWTESERNDGNNRFVNLRGGCRRWTLPGSWWYLPGAPYGETVGGPQPHDSHVKYFLMYPGLDRASTIGFRCIR